MITFCKVVFCLALVLGAMSGYIIMVTFCKVVFWVALVLGAGVIIICLLVLSIVNFVQILFTRKGN